MADKTKMIFRNDVAKNKNSKCDGCGDEFFDPIDPRPVTEDMMDFILEQDHWSEREAPSICWGMVIAVFKVVFDIAPTEKQAVQLITDCMSEFLEGDSADA